jgi:hypothetical protein
MTYKNITHPVRASDETITHSQRECAYIEGELAFEIGKWRVCNPYTASSPTLEQVWMNGWDHGRRIKKSESTLIANGTKQSKKQAVKVLYVSHEIQKAGQHEREEHYC